MPCVDVFTKFSFHFCIILISLLVTCMNGSDAKTIQKPEIHNTTLIEVATSSSALSESPSTLPTHTRTTSLLATQLKSFRWRIKNCIQRTKDTTWNCLKASTLQAFDELTTAAVIPIWPGVRFVRPNDNARNRQIKDESEMVYRRQDLQHITWFDALAMRLARVLESHVLQLNLKEITEACMKILDKRATKDSIDSQDIVGTARSRRHRFNMMITMMFGVTALGAVLVPMGFQFLSVVSGKALLLAKMALLLASINGLKRVANSGVHYGLYQVPADHYGGYYDRGDLHHPRNVATIPLTQPIEFGTKK